MNGEVGSGSSWRTRGIVEEEEGESEEEEEEEEEKQRRAGGQRGPGRGWFCFWRRGTVPVLGTAAGVGTGAAVPVRTPKGRRWWWE